MGSRRKGRAIHGILLLDKPNGITSNAALQKVRWLYQAQKAGHTGSLDPLATGMLPICFGEATKFSNYLLNSEKAYEVTAQFGVTTTTADAEGEVLSERVIEFSDDLFDSVIDSFRGHSLQVPSMFSALKHNGTPLYKLARQGIEVERKARPIEIKALNLIERTYDSASFYVHCTKGTYIRNLIEDIGEGLGCGAHVTKLRRVWTAHFNQVPMVSLDELIQLKENNKLSEMDELILPIDEALVGVPKVTLSDEMGEYFIQGQAVTVSGLQNKDSFAVYNQKQLLGIGELNKDSQLAPKRLIAQQFLD